MIKIVLRMLAGLFLLLAFILFYERGRLEDGLIAGNPRHMGGEYSEQIGLHNWSIPATHDQHTEHLLLEIGGFASILVFGLIIVSGKAK